MTFDQLPRLSPVLLWGLFGGRLDRVDRKCSMMRTWVRDTFSARNLGGDVAIVPK
jgi:hypothetical protein